MVCPPVQGDNPGVLGSGFSCIPDKDIHVFYLGRQFISHPCCLTRGRIKITCIKCIGCIGFIGSHISTSSGDVGFFTAVTSENYVTLCKLDVNIKNRMAVADSVDFFKLSRNPLKEKSVIS